MQVTAYRTPPVRPNQSLWSILDENLPTLREREVVVVTSKIVSICEGSIIPKTSNADKKELIKQESDAWYEDDRTRRYDAVLTIKRDSLPANAGIDESNGDGNFILWPKDPDASAERIWRYLRDKHGLAHLGVIISDSRILPLRWGTVGVAISWCGFLPLKNYIGTPDIFGRKLRVTKASHLDGLAAAAVLAMGEGSEQTPLAVIADARFVTFQDYPPSQEERKSLRIALSDDFYAPLLTGVRWQKK